MNSYITAITKLDLDKVSVMARDPKWIAWAEPSKDALHYLCGIGPQGDPEKAEAALKMLKLLLKNGMDINSVQPRFTRKRTATIFRRLRCGTPTPAGVMKSCTNTY